MAWRHLPHALVKREAGMVYQNERIHEKLSYYERGHDPSVARTLLCLKGRRRAEERRLTRTVAWFLPLSP